MKKEDFPKDRTYANLYRAVSRCNYKKVDQYAHELRDIANKFEFEQLSDQCESIINAIRIKCEKGIPGLFKDLEAEYERIIRGL